MTIVAERPVAGLDRLRAFVAADWLPARYAEPDPARYTQYLLYRDPRDRRRSTTTAYGGWSCLRGAELVESFDRDDAGALVSRGDPDLLGAGQVDAVSPTVGDLHRVANAFADRVSVSIHVYGADIGRVERATYDLDGQPRPFVSGYADAPLPDLGELR